MSVKELPSLVSADQNEAMLKRKENITKQVA